MVKINRPVDSTGFICICAFGDLDRWSRAFNTEKYILYGAIPHIPQKICRNIGNIYFMYHFVYKLG